MNNKRLGTEFERTACEVLNRDGWWVHFITPDARGAQPFDIIAVKCGEAVAIDCKTSERFSFSINRLEDNQRFAFDKWVSAQNSTPIIFVQYKGEIRLVPYNTLKTAGRVDLRECEVYENSGSIWRVWK